MNTRSATTSILLLALALAPSCPASADADSVATSRDSPARQIPSEEDSALRAKVAAAQAAWDEGPGKAPVAGSPVSGASLGGALVQVFASLAVLAAAAIALLFLVRRVRSRNAMSQSKAGLVDILETRAAGPSRQISLVRIHNRVVAVAFSGQSATLLSEFSGAEAAEIVAETGDGKTSIKEFAATLDHLMDRFRSHPSSQDEPR